MTGDVKAAARRPYEQDDAFRSVHVVDGVLSPDGAFAVYQITETVPGTTRDDDKQASALWRVDLAGGDPRRLTPKGGNAGSPRFTRDGRAVLFVSARGDAGAAGPVTARGGTGRVAQIHRLPIDGGEAEPITTLEQGVSTFVLSPDGEWIAYAALEAVPKPRGPHEHLRITRQSYRLDPAPGYLQDMPQAVYLIPSRGGEAKRLTSHDGLVSAMSWSPDSREIAFVVVGGADRTTVFSGELGVVGRDGHERRIVDDALISSLFWTTDGRQIGYGAPPGSFATQPQLFLVDKDGGAPVCRTDKFDRAVKGSMHTSGPALLVKSHLLPTADGAGVIASVNDGGETSLYEIALSGEEHLKPLNSGDHNCNAFDLVGSTLLFSSQDCNTPSELWALDLKSGAARALTRHNAEWQAEIDWPDVEHLKVESAPGVEVEGWVLKPKGEGPFKTILYIHGGPHVAHGYTYSEDFQELVGAGYALAFANPRGSTGYGDDFAGAIIGCWGHPETADFNAFLDELVKRGVADPDRLGVTGVSGGGHLSGWLIGQTDRFKAAIPEQGVYNMFSMYGVSDVGIDLIGLEMDGPPHEQVLRYWDLSPIAYAHKAKTPTLLIQGENDIRCPMEQAEQFYAVLKHNGCDVEFLRLKDCNHALEWYGPPPLRRVRMDAIKDWFARYIH